MNWGAQSWPNLPGEAEENHEKPQSGEIMSWVRFKIVSPEYKSYVLASV
jgi:hypothetical protein